MDCSGVARFRAAIKPFTLTIPLCAILSVSVLINFRQYRLIQQQTANAKVKKQTEEQRQAELKQRTARAAANKRVDQLYQEIESLSRASDQILIETQRSRNDARTQDSLVEPVGKQ